MRASFCFMGETEYPLFDSATWPTVVASFTPPGQAPNFRKAGCRIIGSKLITPARGLKKMEIFFTGLPGDLSGFFKNNVFLNGIQIFKEEEEGEEEVKPKTEEIPKIEVIVKDKEKPEEEIPSESGPLEEEPEEAEEEGWGSGESSIVGKKAPEEEEEREEEGEEEREEEGEEEREEEGEEVDL